MTVTEFPFAVCELRAACDAPRFLGFRWVPVTVTELHNSSSDAWGAIAATLIPQVHAASDSGDALSAGLGATVSVR